MFSNGNSTNFSEMAEQGIIKDSQIEEKNKTEKYIYLQEKQELINPMLKAMEDGNNFQNNFYSSTNPYNNMNIFLLKI